jgi:glycerate kinase
MHILIAPDKFKGTLSARQACDAIARGVRRADSHATLDLCPLSDGGEGFVDAMVGAVDGERIRVRVTGPLPEMKVDAVYALVRDSTAVIELACCAGLALLPRSERNPMYTTTFGVGETIVDAVARGAKRVLLGIGGSATCDAGIGCLQACGCHIVLRSGEYARMSEPLRGANLDDVVLVKSHRGSPVDGVDLVVACDVANPLYGENGAALVYAQQKGASPDEAMELDRMLRQLAQRTGTVDAANAAGSGAAGGIGYGLRAFMGATIERGFDLVAGAVELERRVRDADIVITGEGRLDATSRLGKVTGNVAQLAHRLGKRLVTICGDVDRAVDFSDFGDVVALTDRHSLEASQTEAASQLEAAAVIAIGRMPP